ncbi:uncharacterized protein [Epargyreus clarus]|uniref:uncharacterized protein n=1 Tax=Epargyreus clarus TaxID=520877 RepID=UPI003C2C4E72
MKRVRFVTPTKRVMDSLEDYECQSPRPFVERQILNIAHDVTHSRPLVFTNDPVQRYENGDCSPYPNVRKTCLNEIPKLQDRKAPSTDLDLSMLDYSQPKCRPSSPKLNTVSRAIGQNRNQAINFINSAPIQAPNRVLTSIENKTNYPPNTLSRDNDFFLRRENLGKLSPDPIQRQFSQLGLNKESNPLLTKNEVIRKAKVTPTLFGKENYEPAKVEVNGECRCHHCVKSADHIVHNLPQDINRNVPQPHGYYVQRTYNPHTCVSPPHSCSCNCNMQIVQPACHCNSQPLLGSNGRQSPLTPQNAVDKKTWAIQKYEKAQRGECSEIEKPDNVFKEKREPTVSDLFKIIKLQNEQLQLLQEKVDKFISAHNEEIQEKQKLPIQNFVSEQVAVQTVNSEQHKISIGVMTSFEMVRTSTVINKEIVKQSEAQIQCNRSQISIKEVVAKKQTDNLNFLDGIPPVSKNVEMVQLKGLAQTHPNINNIEGCQSENILEDKTLNELSLYNVQVDNATTPLMSPEQSLYLDIRDYSESDSGSDDQSNVGWTYYNKVMTHVNGMLQDSDMPSSASALYRHTKQKCMQMQIDKSNVSVGKRVTFGDDPLGIQQQYATTPTDTSLKINQLAAKYLKSSPGSHTPSPRQIGEMSFATRNYMERHKLLQGNQLGRDVPIQSDIPKFLDITALKQQPKFI